MNEDHEILIHAETESGAKIALSINAHIPLDALARILASDEFSEVIWQKVPLPLMQRDHVDTEDQTARERWLVHHKGSKPGALVMLRMRVHLDAPDKRIHFMAAYRHLDEIYEVLGELIRTLEASE